MSLERKDVRAKLDPELHAQLVAICRIDGIDIADFIEGLLVPVIRKRLGDAIALANEFPELVKNGNRRE